MLELIHLRTTKSQTYLTGRAVGPGKAEVVKSFHAGEVYLPDLRTPVDFLSNDLSGSDTVKRRLAGGARVTFDRNAAAYTLEKQGKAMRYECMEPADFITADGNKVLYRTRRGHIPITFLVSRTTVQQFSDLSNRGVEAPAFRRVADRDGVDAFAFLRPKIYDPETMRALHSGDVTFDPDGRIRTGFDMSRLPPGRAIRVDPTSSFTTPANDSAGYASSTVYGTARGAASADSGTIDNTRLVQFADTDLQGTIYYVERGYCPFDTSSLDDAAVISAAVLKLFYSSAQDNQTTRVETCLGTWPLPPTDATWDDFTYASGGYINVADITVGAYNNITLNTTGRSWISLTGTTKITTVGGLDFDNIAPTGRNYVQYHSSEGANDPTLDVTFNADALSLTGITPSSGTRPNQIAITNLAGVGLSGSGPTVKLRKAGYSDISATSVVQVSSTKVTCVFDLS